MKAAAAAVALVVGSAGPGWSAFEMILPEPQEIRTTVAPAGETPKRSVRPMQEPVVPEDSSCIVTVKAGDTLAGIAERTLGDGGRWREIAELNRMGDPDRIAAGWRLAWPCPEDRAGGDDVAAIAREALDSLESKDDPATAGSPESGNAPTAAVDPGTQPAAPVPGNLRAETIDADGSAKAQLDDPEVTPELVRAAAPGAQVEGTGSGADGGPKETALAGASPADRSGPADTTAATAGGRTGRSGCSALVMKGDSLPEIARRELGDGRRWPEIAALNRLADPDRIAAGDELRLPCDFRKDTAESEGRPDGGNDPASLEAAAGTGDVADGQAWTAAPGEMLDDVIVRWALEAGWQPIVSERWYWRFGTEYAFVGRFGAAVADVLKGFPATGTAPGIRYYDNRVIELIYR